MSCRKCEKTGWVLGACAFALALLMCAPAWAGEGEQAGGATSGTEEISDKDLKKPWDFAPEERVIEGRERAEYVRQGTLLSNAEHVDVVHDDDELWERRIALYEGETSVTGTTVARSGPPQSEVGETVSEESAGRTDEVEQARTRGWAKVGLVVFILSALGAGLTLGRRGRTR